MDIVPLRFLAKTLGSIGDSNFVALTADQDQEEAVRLMSRYDRIALPVPKPTCCAFGGPDLATLYITTSRLGMTEDEIARAPLSGGLFAARPGFRGIEDIPFAG